MQHYGVPTRLLDWSASPLVAAFFEVEDGRQADACVWVLRPGALNGRNGRGGHLHPLDSNTAMGMMQSAFISHEDDWVSQNDWDVLACCGVGRDPRAYTQQSCFTVHRDASLHLDDVAQHPEFQ